MANFRAMLDSIFCKHATFDADLRRRIAEAEAQVKADPSKKEQNSGIYQKGHVTIQGLGITIETAQGQWRRDISKDGTPWEIKLSNSYGYIKGTDSAEPGDQMDVFLGPDPELEIVFVVDQNKGDTDVFDEHKVVLGCRTASQAKQLYITNYSVGWKGFRSITPLTMPQFKAWLATGDMKTPLAGQQMASFYKVAAIDGHRVGMYGAIPIVGPAVAASSLNLQDRTRSRSLNSLRDWLLTTVGQGVGAWAGGAAGQAMFGSPTSLIQRANQHLLNTGDVSGLSAFAAPVAGLAGSSALGAAIGGYGGGRLAAYLRSKDEADATPDPDKKLHSTLLALLSPTTASSLMEDRPLAIGTKGLVGTIAGSVVPFAGGALSHYVLHENKKLATTMQKQAAPPPGLLRQVLQAIKPRLTADAAMNPTGADAMRALGYGAASVPVLTPVLNKQIYGNLMGQTYLDQNGVSQPGLPPQGKVWESMINAGLVASLLHPSTFNKFLRNPAISLTGKGAVIAGVPFLSNLGTTSYNASRGSQSGADAAGDAAKLLKSMAALGPGIERAAPMLERLPASMSEGVSAMREGRNWATPFLTGGAGAAVGNLAGQVLESDSRTMSTKERDRQRRQRLLLTLGGGALGTYAGMRSGSGKPALMPTDQEWTAGKETLTGLLGKARSLVGVGS